MGIEGNFTIGKDARTKYIRFNFRFSIGLHVDDRPLLEFIQTKLNCGSVSNNKENTASYFNITDTNDLKFKLIPIFESFPLNTTKYLDFLSFKEALFMELPDTYNYDLRDTRVKEILNLKSSMNSKQTDLILPVNHIRNNPY